jgi:hypothetical protein
LFQSISQLPFDVNQVFKGVFLICGLSFRLRAPKL